MQFVFGVIERLKERFLKAVIRQDITWYDLNTSMNFATKVSDANAGVSDNVIRDGCDHLVRVRLGADAGHTLIQSSLTTQELKAYSVAGVIAEEVLSAIRTVAAFGGEEKEIARLEPAQNMGIRKGVFSGIGSGIMWFIIYATYALSFWYGVGLILDCRRDPIFFSVLQGAQNVGLTAPHLEAMANARASAGSIFAVMDRKPQIDSLSTEGARPELTGDLQLKNVYFKSLTVSTW
ncbi:unnamed protein product [Leptidea sinapis]|uniref:ABC transmembrane type-1 domain-containing protein n=1 Tax=Leptidea sinapis TaxID=189913 RepID=A0A5E4PKM3_9NEOP|nr:unnamed protein product [Leptidea sinapis]